MTSASHHEDSNKTFQQAQKKMDTTLRSQFANVSPSFRLWSVALQECTLLNIDEQGFVVELTGVMNTNRADIDDALATVEEVFPSYNEVTCNPRNWEDTVMTIANEKMSQVYTLVWLVTLVR